MKVQRTSIKEDFSRDLFWTRIVFSRDDEIKTTQVLACVSQEYLEDIYRISRGQRLKQGHFDQWLQLVIDKWLKLRDALFDKDVHYDVYANDMRREAAGIDFLLKEIN